MTDRPIIFSAPMVRALLDGRKTQTRRVMKPPYGTLQYLGSGEWKPICTKFFPGDRLYVREAHSLHSAHGQGRDDGTRWGPWEGLPTAISPDGTQIAYYREEFDRSGPPRWRPSIHMPRWASRLTLIVTDVRVQRLQEISEADALAEGCPAQTDGELAGMEASGWFRDLWCSLHGADAWAENPWVCPLTFTVQHGNIDRIGGAQ